ncbi:molybdopterin molybdotransferase MoeA [Cellulomonas dongxiuzhuiae]|uniref:molybdopterin molybdotransferase MoeA n=1 Tax=Cellulomonas dongxiuzhuiae TaxID=2819979 RepID=UPI001AAE59E6|nr:gephyrin-like molybdotransferase Glp [Cellulomonas dongxiuzhuiae]MBO3088878.1 molybdopterin molybdotransferase MoeA [Cellulomonas dongxiuzhuiae]
MRSVQEHLAAVLAAAGPVPPLDVVLHDAAGCILAADVVAPVDVPAVAVASRDGYAVAAHDTTAGGAHGPSLPVAHDLHAGSPAGLRHVPGTAVRVASGAPLPLGADAVVPVEETDRGQARVAFQRSASPGQHVRRAGDDVRAGGVVLTAGTRLGARQIALAAAMGRGRLTVHPTPRVVLLSVGDELVEPTTSARPGTVFEVDGHALEAAVHDAGATAVRVGVVPDDHAALREALEDQLVRADLVVLTGGLSELARDTVKDVLAPLGTVRLDQVAMTPGLRQGFGIVGALGLDLVDEGGRTVPLFALQGHPVAAQVSFEVFVRPALRAMAGYTELFRPSVAAAATHGWASPAGLRQFVPATVLGSPDEGYRATPLGDPSAPSTTALAHANALAVVGEGDLAVRPGDVVHCLVLEG